MSIFAAITRLALLGLLCLPVVAVAAEIDPTQPAAGPYNATPIRNNFQASLASINALRAMNAGATAPSLPSLSMLWMQTPASATLYTQNIWDGLAWVAQGVLNAATHSWLPLGNGNQTGAITADGYAVLGISGATNTNAQTIYNQSVFSASATNFKGYDAGRGVAFAPIGSTVNTITGLAGYTVNNVNNSAAPLGGGTVTVGVFANAICQAGGSQCWGFDSLVSDNPTSGNTGVTAGGLPKTITNEMDINVSNAATIGTILNLGGTALPTNVTLGMNGLGINKLWGAGGPGAGTALLANGVIVADACCQVGLAVGASALSGASVSGMPVLLAYRAGNNTVQNVTLTASASGGGSAGTLFISGSGSQANLLLTTGSVFLPAGQAVFVGGTAGVTCAPGVPSSSFATLGGVVTHC